MEGSLSSRFKLHQKDNNLFSETFKWYANCNNFGAVGKRARMLGLTPFSFTDTDVILHLSSPGKWKQKAGNSMGRCSDGPMTKGDSQMDCLEIYFLSANCIQITS